MSDAFNFFSYLIIHRYIGETKKSISKKIYSRLIRNFNTQPEDLTIVMLLCCLYEIFHSLPLNSTE